MPKPAAGKQTPCFPAAELIPHPITCALDPVRWHIVVVMNLLSVSLIGQIDTLVGPVCRSLFKHALIQVNNIAFKVGVVFENAPRQRVVAVPDAEKSSE